MSQGSVRLRSSFPRLSSASRPSFSASASWKNGVSAFDAATMEDYQLKGTASYVTEGPVVETFKKLVSDMFHGAATAKGALIITPESVIVTTPGASNKKVL